MVEPHATRFWTSAEKSGLIDAACLALCWEAIPPEKRTSDAIDRRLARQAVEAGYLTLWQAQQVLAGRFSGYKIDKYILLDRLGQGGMGRVYLALDTRLNRRVALKVLSPDRVNNLRAVARFQREAKLGAQLQHENLVRIYDDGDAKGIRYLVMEYIEGKTVGQIISHHGPLRPGTAAAIVRQVAYGLDHALRKGLIHRDVNPWNILVTKEGVAKLTDLGLAIDLSGQDAVTRDGATVGTFDYISPEQAKNSRGVDTRSDIYSLGCTLYHMISGNVPFPFASLPEKLYAHQLGEPEPLRASVPTLPAALDEVVRRMMRKAPEDRYASPRAVADALEPFDTGVPTLAQIESPPPPVPSAEDVASTEVAPREERPEGPPADRPEEAHPESPLAGMMGSNPLIPLIDLGPELPISAGLTSSRTKRESTTIEGPRRLSFGGVSRPIVVAAIAAGVTILTALGLGVYYRYINIPSLDGIGPGPFDGRATAGERPIAQAASSGVVVRWSDGKEDPAADLREAVERASGRAEIVLNSRKAVHFLSTKSLTTSSGTLVIRAAPGARPLIQLELASKEPFLSTTSGGHIKLVGLRFQVAYDGSAGAVPPPVIRSSGDLTIEKCWFATVNPVKGAILARAEGLKTTLTGCWISGFDQALDVIARQGSETRVSQSMIVGSQDNRTPSSWAIRLERAPAAGGEGASKLFIDHCTIFDGGLLELVGITEKSASAEVEATAVQTLALLFWGPVGPEFPKGLTWAGRNNRYDVSEDGWVVHRASPSSRLIERLPKGPSDLDSWKKICGGKTESQTKAGPITFAKKEATRAITRFPEHFALTGKDMESVGANPKTFGP